MLKKKLTWRFLLGCLILYIAGAHLFGVFFFYEDFVVKADSQGKGITLTPTKSGAANASGKSELVWRRAELWRNWKSQTGMFQMLVHLLLGNSLCEGLLQAEGFSKETLYFSKSGVSTVFLEYEIWEQIALNRKTLNSTPDLFFSPSGQKVCAYFPGRQESFFIANMDGTDRVAVPTSGLSLSLDCRFSSENQITLEVRLFENVEEKVPGTQPKIGTVEVKQDGHYVLSLDEKNDVKGIASLN